MASHITRALIEAKKSDYEAIQAAFHAEAKIDQDFIHADTQWRSNLLAAYISGFPKGFVHKGIPIARMAVEAAKNTVMAGEVPDVSVSLRLEEGQEPSEAMERRRKRTELFAKAFLYESAMRSSTNPYSELLRKEYGLGPGILSFPWDESLWPEDEEAQKEAWGWRIEVIHPANILPDPYNDPPQDYIIADEIPRSVARERYPELDWSQEEITGKVTRLAYCSEEYYAVYIGGQAVLGGDDGVVENPMGMLWYELALSGLGEYNETSDPVYLWQGLVRPLRGVISMIITNYNIIEAVKWQESFGPKHVTGPTEDDAKDAAKRLEWSPLHLWYTGPNYSVENVFEGASNKSMIWENTELQRWIEILIGPQILSGNYQENTASGLAQRVSLQQAPFQAGKVAAEQAIANMLRKVMRFYKTQIGKFHLRYQGELLPFNPDDLLDTADITVDLKPVTAADRALSADKDRGDVQAGAISIAEYRRRQAIDNGREMDKERALEGLLFHPAVVDAAAQMIVQTLAPQPPPEQAEAASPPPQESFNPNPAPNGQPSLLESMRFLPIPSGPGR